MPTVPVLMYHHVNPNKGDMITVAPDVFEKQMRHIKEKGYRTLSLSELIDFIEGRVHFKEKCVAITFDDGYLDNYIYAYPILKRYGLRAAVFLVSRWVDGASVIKDKKAVVDEFKKRPVTHSDAKALAEKKEFERFSISWDMVFEMRKSGLIEFYSHTASHSACDTISGEEVLKELKESKATIESRLRERCDLLCWPKGKFNAATVEAAKQAGYKGLFTTIHGIVKKGSSPFSIKRIVVKDKADWFKSRLRIYTNPLMAEVYLRFKKA